MSDHPMGRRAYDIDDHDMLTRVDMRVGALLEHAELLNGRITGVEVRLRALEDMHAEERGASRERGHWFAVVKTVKDLTPAGGIAAAVALAVHQLLGTK